MLFRRPVSFLSDGGSSSDRYAVGRSQPVSYTHLDVYKRQPYECMGDVPNVVFPCATLADADTGRIAIYYGCADTVTGLAFTTVDELISYMKENSL